MAAEPCCCAVDIRTSHIGVSSDRPSGKFACNLTHSLTAGGGAAESEPRV